MLHTRTRPCMPTLLRFLARSRLTRANSRSISSQGHESSSIVWKLTRALKSSFRTRNSSSRLNHGTHSQVRPALNHTMWHLSWSETLMSRIKMSCQLSALIATTTWSGRSTRQSTCLPSRLPLKRWLNLLETLMAHNRWKIGQRPTKTSKRTWSWPHRRNQDRITFHRITYQWLWMCLFTERKWPWAQKVGEVISQASNHSQSSHLEIRSSLSVVSVSPCKVLANLFRVYFVTEDIDQHVAGKSSVMNTSSCSDEPT